jgi:hypothetical protein
MALVAATGRGRTCRCQALGLCDRIRETGPTADWGMIGRHPPPGDLGARLPAVTKRRTVAADAASVEISRFAVPNPWADPGTARLWLYNALI